MSSAPAIIQAEFAFVQYPAAPAFHLCLKQANQMENKDFNIGIAASAGADEVIKKISKVPEWWGVNFTGSAEKTKR